MFPFGPSKNEQRCKAHYQQARTLYGEGRIDDAIFALGVAIGANPQPEIYQFLGHLYSAKEEFEKAAIAYCDGRWLVESELGLLPARIPETVTGFLYDEALAYLRADNWEFARIRSQRALSDIEFGRAVRYSSHGDSESWLRLIRMIAALQENFDLCSAQADASWLKEKSIVEGYSDIYIPVLSATQTDTRTAKVVLERWKRYDSQRRALPICWTN